MSKVTKYSISTILLMFLLSGAVFVGYSIAKDNAPPVLTQQEKSLLNNLSDAFAKVSERSKPSVVSIHTTKTVQVQSSPFDDFFNDNFFSPFGRSFQPKPKSQPREFKQKGLGSGVIVDDKGHILTNNHVVSGATELKVNLSDGRSFDAQLVGSDDKTDLAVLKIDGSGLPVAELGDSDMLKVGHWVIAVGSPFGWEHTVSTGIVSAFGRSLGNGNIADFIQTDAAINPGNSGGPLLNLEGKVVGINTAISSRSGGNNGVGFSIPINLAKRVLKSIIKDGKFDRGMIGVSIQNVTQDLADAMGLEKTLGALVSEVVPNGPAKKADIRPGDVIVKVNGHKIQNTTELSAKVAVIPVGEKAEVEILRQEKDGIKTLTKELKIASQESLASVTNDKSKELKDLGLKIQNLTPELSQKYNLDNNEKGVLVTEVTPDSSASEAGITKGDIIKKLNNIEINNVDDFNDNLSNSNKNLCLLWIKRNKSFLFVTIKKSK